MQYLIETENIDMYKYCIIVDTEEEDIKLQSKDDLRHISKEDYMYNIIPTEELGSYIQNEDVVIYVAVKPNAEITASTFRGMAAYYIDEFEFVDFIYVKDLNCWQIKEFCNAALDTNICLYKYAKNNCDDIFHLAAAMCSETPLLQYIPNPSETIMILAVCHNPYNYYALPAKYQTNEYPFKKIFNELSDKSADLQCIKNNQMKRIIKEYLDRIPEESADDIAESLNLDNAPNAPP